MFMNALLSTRLQHSTFVPADRVSTGLGAISKARGGSARCGVRAAAVGATHVLVVIRSPYLGTSLRLQCCGTAQETFAVRPRAPLAVLRNRKPAPFSPDARMHLRSRLLSPMPCPPSGLPYRPAVWPNLRQSPVAP